MPAGRSRSTGERDVGSRPAGQRPLDARPARRRPSPRADASRAAFANLDLVAAKQDLAAATVHLSALEGGERYLADALSGHATDGYGFVFLDCPPAFGPLTVNALAAADSVVVPVQAEYYALEGLSQLLGSIDLVKRRLNPRLGIAGILLTMVDGRTRLAERGRARAARALRRPRLHHDRAPLGAPRRGAEPRPPRDRLRPPVGRRAGLLEGGDGACRAFLKHRRPAAASAAGSRSSSAARGETELLHLPVDAIHPNPRQPRKRFEPEATTGLAASIRHQGVLQPVVVRPRPEGGYELIAGERRWRAAREAGIATLPAVVRQSDDRDALLLGLVENVARENLSPVEEARAYAVADRRVRALARRRRRARRPLEAVGLEPATPARAARAGALDARPRRADRGSRARGARAPRRRRRASGSRERIARDGMTVRAAEKAARDGGARRRRTALVASTPRSPTARAAPRRGSPGSRRASPPAGSSSTSATRRASRSSSRRSSASTGA